MSADTLRELQAALSQPATDEDADRWWPLVERVTSELQADLNTTPRELELLTRLRSDVSTLIRSVREGLPSPSVSSAHAAISALS